MSYTIDPGSTRAADPSPQPDHALEPHSARKTRRPLVHLDNPETAEILAFGCGIPPAPIRRELRAIWWRLRAHGVHLPAERRIIVVGGQR